MINKHKELLAREKKFIFFMYFQKSIFPTLADQFWMEFVAEIKAGCESLY